MRDNNNPVLVATCIATLVVLSLVAYINMTAPEWLEVTRALTTSLIVAGIFGYGWFMHRRTRTLEAQLGEDLKLFRKVQDITSNESLSLDQQIHYLLDVGRDLLDLPLAIVSEIVGDDYRVCYVRSPEGGPPVGTQFALGDTYCSHTLTAGRPTGFHHAGQSEINCHPCYINFQLESYLGMAIEVDGRPYGTLNFSSPQARPNPFDERAYEFLAVLAYWIGNRLTQKRTQREARKRNKALENAIEGISHLDTEGRYQSVNSAYAGNAGYRPEEMIGMDWRKTVHPDDMADLEEVYHRMLNEGRATAEARGVRKDGTVFHKQITLVTDYGDDLAIIGHYCFMQDITNAVQARVAMARQQALFEALMRDTPDPMILCDLERRITAVNPAFSEVFGYRQEEIIGHTTALLYPDEQAFLQQGEERFHLSAEDKLLPYEQPYRRKDGTLFVSETVGTTLKDKAGNPLAFYGHIRDITERKRLEKLKEEFISTVSHELRTPLTSIRGALGLLSNGAAGALPDEAIKLTQVAERNSERLIRLINDILDMEKVSAGTLEVSTVQSSVSELVEQAVESNCGYADKHRVKLRLENRLDARVEVDPDRFEQILSNLISNAVKFSPEQATVSIRMEKQGTTIRISVIDAGKGIPEAFRPSVFERFRQADASDRRQQAGTGLGLAISKALVELMNGRIDFDSAVGVGSCFWIELPVVNDVQRVDHEPAPRILVVEDDPLTAEFLATVMGGDGFAVELAHDAESARKKLAQGHFDMVTIDPGLPDQNGLDLVHELRNEQAATLPIVVVSSRSPSEQALRDPGLALADWLAKPVCQEALLGRLKSAMAAHRRPRVLHVEDDRDIAETVAMVGHKVGDFESAYTLAEARQRLQAGRYDLVLLDLNLPDGRGWQLLPDIHEQPTKPAVVVFSSEEVSQCYAGQVDSNLTKSRARNDQLVETLSRVLAGKLKEASYE